MKSIVLRVILFLAIIPFIGCKKSSENSKNTLSNFENSIHYAKGLEIYKHQGFSIVKITNPWPDAKENFTYILLEKNGIIPDSLK